MKKSSLPTRKECLAIIEEHHVPPHIVNHSLTAAKLAVFLAQRLTEKGITIDFNLVDRACMLHDIVRICNIKELDCNRFEQTVTAEDKAKWQQLRAKYEGIPHEYAAYDILKDKFPVLALTIKKHRYIGILNKKEKPNTWEEKLVYYADMRVMHEEIVPLEERLTEAHKRNVFFYDTEAQSKIVTAKVDLLIYRLEKEIFEKVGLDPVEITDEFIDSNSTTDNRAPSGNEY